MPVFRSMQTYKARLRERLGRMISLLKRVPGEERLSRYPLLQRLKHGGKKPATPERKNAIHYVRHGMAEYNEHAMRDAERYFRRAIACDDHYARAHLYLGNTLYKQGKFTDAFEEWQRAAEAEPGSEPAASAETKLRKLGQGGGDLVTNLKSQFQSGWGNDPD